MFSEYLEDIKPSDDILEEWEEELEEKWQKSKENNKSNVDNSGEKEKDNNTELSEKKEQERQAEEAKAKINEWYNVLSNWYPQWFQKALSNVEKDGKEISNILNINFWENENWKRHLSLSISKQDKEEWKESSTTSNITWEFSNFQEKNDNDNNTQNSSNNQDNNQNIFPQINISKFWNNQDLWHMLSQLLQWTETGTENESQNNIQNTEHLLNWTELQQQNNAQELIWFIDKSIMRSPINNVYGYANKQHIDNILHDIDKQNNKENPDINNVKENEIHDYILNTINKDTLSVYKKNVFDVILCLCIVLRNSSSQEIADLKNTNTENENEKSLLTSISTLTNENMVEYLSSNLDFLLDNNLKSWTLQKYWDDMEMEEFNFLTL